jgi:Ni/Co efflux regulator RcnB
MTRNKLFTRISGAALVPVLAFALGSSAAYAQDRDDHRDMHRDDARDHGRDQDRGRDFHFSDQHRQHFEEHYRGDADHWRNRHDRVHFVRGERIPAGYRLQPVPQTYYRDVAPPPPGYRYGYYEGYVVAYDPTTRAIGDVLDLVGTAMNH